MKSKIAHNKCNAQLMSKSHQLFVTRNYKVMVFFGTEEVWTSFFLARLDTGARPILFKESVSWPHGLSQLRWWREAAFGPHYTRLWRSSECLARKCRWDRSRGRSGFLWHWTWPQTSSWSQHSLANLLERSIRRPVSLPQSTTVPSL